MISQQLSYSLLSTKIQSPMIKQNVSKAMFRRRMRIHPPLLNCLEETHEHLSKMNIQTSKDVEINDVENGLIILTWLSIWNDYVMFSNTICWILIFFSRSNGLLNFRSNGLQVVALMSVFFRSFVLPIRSNVFRRYVYSISSIKESR